MQCAGEGLIRIAGPNVVETRPISIADISAVNPSPPPPAVKYSGSLAAGFTATRGNTDTMAGNAAARFTARAKRQRFRIKGKYNYGETDGVLTTRNVSGSIKYDFFVYEGLYTYAHSLFERDDFQDLRLRSTLGAGLGYQILDEDDVALSLEAGCSYVNSNYEIAEDEEGTAGRWALDFDYKIVPEKVRFYHSHEGYYNFEDETVYITSETGLRLTIVKNFFAHAGVEYSYDSDPPEGNEDYDVTYIAGLGYEFDL